MDRDTNILMGQTDRKTTRQTDLPLDKVIISHVHATKIFQFKVKYNLVISRVRCLFFKLTENSIFGQRAKFSKRTNQPTNQPCFSWLSMQEIIKWVMCNF